MRASDKKQVARIERIMVPWLKRFDLFNTWVIDVQLAEEACCGECAGPSDALALIITGTPYKRAVITINRDKLAETSTKGVEEMVVHELTHILLQPLMSECATAVGPDKPPPPRLRDALEGVTDTLSHLLLWDAKGKRQHGTTSGRS
jgi:hypothetical protein